MTKLSHIHDRYDRLLCDLPRGIAEKQSEKTLVLCRNDGRKNKPEKLKRILYGPVTNSSI